MDQTVDLKLKVDCSEVQELIELMKKVAAMKDRLEALERLVLPASFGEDLSLHDKVSLLWERSKGRGGP